MMMISMNKQISPLILEKMEELASSLRLLTDLVKHCKEFGLESLNQTSGPTTLLEIIGAVRYDLYELSRCIKKEWSLYE